MTLLCTVFITLNILLSNTATSQQTSTEDPSAQLSPTISSRINSSVFISTFLRTIRQSSVLKNALKMAFSEPITQELYYDDMLDTMSRLGIPTPTNSAKDLSNTIRFVSGVLSPGTFAFAFASALEIFLTNEKVLTSANAAKVVRKYASILQNALSSKKSSFVKTFAEATIQFIETFTELTPNKAYILGTDIKIGLYSLKDGVPSPQSNATEPLNSRIKLENNTSLFAATFSRALAQSQTLRSVFSSPLRTPVTTKLYFGRILVTLSKAGVLRPEPLAFLLDGSIRPVLETITPSSYAYVVVTAMENFLKDQGLLTSDNAENLSKRYAKLLEWTAYTFGQPRKPQSYMDVFIRATLQYLSNLNILDTETVQIIADYYVRILCKIKD